MPTNHPKTQQQAPEKKYSPGFHTSPIVPEQDIMGFYEQQEAHYMTPYSQRHPEPPARTIDPSERTAEQKARMKQERQARLASSLRAAQAPPPVQRAPRPPPQYTPDIYNETNLKATQRKPVGGHDPKIGPQPPAHSRTVAADSVGLQPPENKGSEQVAAGAERYIKVTKDGKWDPRSIHQGWAPSPKATGRSTPPPSYRTPSPHPRSTTPDAPRPLKRTDSSASNASLSSISDGLKRFGSGMRRMSNDFFDGVSRAAELARKSEADRRMIKSAKANAAAKAKRERSEEREKACQADPALRPPHEQEALRRRNQKDLKSDAMRDAGELAAREQLECNRRIRAEVDRLAGDDAQKMGAGDPVESRDPIEKQFTMTSDERTQNRRAHGIREAEAKGFDAYDKIGDMTGKLFDPMRRKGSGDSDFMSDQPPAGFMEACEDCGGVPQHNLRHGKCEECLLQKGRKRAGSGRR